MHRRVALITAILFLSIPGTAGAVNSHNILIFRPAFDRSPFFSVLDARVLGHLEWSTALLADYTSNPLFVGGSKRSKGPVGAVVSTHLAGGIGYGDRYAAGINFPIVPFGSFYDIVTAAKTNQWGLLGDPRLEGKVGLLNPDDFFVGVAFHPFLQIPLGKSERFVGDGGLAGGGELAVSQTLWERVDVGLNVGVNFRNKATVLNVVSDDQLLYGLGVAIRATDFIAVAGEMKGATLLSDFWGRESGRPIDAFGGLKITSAATGLSVMAGGGFGFMNSIGSVDFRAFVGVGWSPPSHAGPEEAVAPSAKPRPRPAVPVAPKPEPKVAPEVKPPTQPVEKKPAPKPPPKPEPKKEEESYEIYELPD